MVQYQPKLKIRIPLVLSLLVALCPYCRAQQSGEALPVVQDSTTANSSPDQQIIDEISEIRARMGGGVAEHLNELLPDTSTDQATEVNGPYSRQQLQTEFRSQLRKIAERRQHGLGAVGESSTAPPSPRFSSENQRMKETAISSLRKAARNLELAAAALEEANRFDQADELRAVAGRIWVDARNQSGDKPPTDRSIFKKGRSAR